LPILVEAISCLFQGERPELAHTARVPAGALYSVITYVM